jgi:DNA ligase 1
LPVFRPFMLAGPFEAETIDLSDYAAEWKWDGIRIQLVHAGGQTRLYSRGGEDISASFPEITRAFADDSVLDGELLVRGIAQGGEAGGRRASTRCNNALAARLFRHCSADGVSGFRSPL